MADLRAGQGYIIVPGGKSYPASENTKVISLNAFLTLGNLKGMN